MEKITRTTTIEMPRYSIEKNEINYYSNFLEVIDCLVNLQDGTNIKVFFNSNNTGIKDFSNRMMGAEEFYFEKIEQIYEKTKQLEMPHFGVISFYRENGYNGIYYRSGEKALIDRPNNWVNQGRDGHMFVILAKESEKRSEFINLLTTYINEGFYEYEIFDNLEEEHIEGCYDHDYKKLMEWQKEMIKKYGFEESDFNGI
jgi:acylphosphatase